MDKKSKKYNADMLHKNKLDSEGMAKEKHRSDKSTEKELIKRVNTVGKINTAKTPKPKKDMSKLKSVKPMKKLKEKLILPEVSNRDKLFNIARGVMVKLVEKYPGRTDYENVFEDAIYSISTRNIYEGLSEDNDNFYCESVIVLSQLLEKYGKIIDKHTALNTIEEAANYISESIPKDLKKSYKRYYGKYGIPNKYGGTDFENSTYEEVTPEEAYKLYKQDPTSIQAIIGGEMVNFDENGKPSSENRVKWVDGDREYTKSTGNTVHDTRKMPAKHIFKIADKIYHVDEKPIDKDLKTKRSGNPESKYYPSPSRWLSSGNDSDYTIFRANGRGNWEVPRGFDGSLDNSDIARCIRVAKDLNSRADEYDRCASDTISDSNREYYISKAKYFRSEAKNKLDKAGKIKRELKDANAARRYLDSTINLQQPFIKLNKLKDELETQKEKLDKVSTDYTNIVSLGSLSTRNNKKELERLKYEMSNLEKKMKMIEISLIDSDLDDQEAASTEKEALDSCQADYDKIKADIDKLFRRKK